MRSPYLSLGFCAGVALLSSCSNLFDSFRVENPQACIHHPLDCPSGQVCNFSTRQCQPQNCRTDGFCWENPRPQLFQPDALYATSSLELWMASADRLYRFSGSTFVPVLVDLPTYVRGIVAHDQEQSSFFIFGDFGTILKWENQRLTIEDSGTNVRLLSGSAQDPDNVYVVGETGTLLQKDSIGWKAIPTGTNVSFTQIVQAPDGLYVLGDDGKVRRKSDDLWSDEAIAAGNLKMVGLGLRGGWPVATNENGLIFQKTQGGWGPVSGPTVSGRPKLSMLASHADNLYVSGTPGDLDFFEAQKWTHWPIRSMSETRTLLALSDGNVWFGGTDLFQKKANALLRVNTGPAYTVAAVSGVNPENVWAVDLGSNILRRNGGLWETFSNHAAQLYGLHSPSPQTAYAVGKGVVVACGPTSCAETAQNGAVFSAIHGNETTLWVAGDTGAIYQWVTERNELALKTGSSSAKSHLKGVFSLSTTDKKNTVVYAVGESGTVIRGDGESTWNVERNTGAGTNTLSAVWASSKDDVWIAGTNGFAARFNGTTWQNFSLGTESVTGISGTSAQDVWAVTLQGSVFHFDGETFKRVSAANLPSLLAVLAVQDRVYLGGISGTILRK